MARPCRAVHRTVLVVDVERFGDERRTDPHRLAIRAGLYSALRRALKEIGFPLTACDHEDRGDGVLVLIPPKVPKSLIVETLPEALTTAIDDHNRTHLPEECFRLRMALHAGEIAYDDYGFAAGALNLTFRLVNAPPLKAALAASDDVLALIVSSWFFTEVVRHSNPTRRGTYHSVTVDVKETTATGWIYLPSQSFPAAADLLTRIPVDDAV